MSLTPAAFGTMFFYSALAMVRVFLLSLVGFYCGRNRPPLAPVQQDPTLVASQGGVVTSVPPRLLSNRFSQAISRRISSPLSAAQRTRPALVPPQSAGILSQLVVYVFLPAFLIDKMAQASDPAAMINWWPMLVLPFVTVAIGEVLARAGLALVRRRHTVSRQTATACLIAASYNNSIGAPLVIVAALASSVSPFKDTMGQAEIEGAALVTLYGSIVGLIFWGRAAPMMAAATPPAAPAEEVPPAALPSPRKSLPTEPPVATKRTPLSRTRLASTPQESARRKRRQARRAHAQRCTSPTEPLHTEPAPTTAALVSAPDVPCDEAIEEATPPTAPAVPPPRQSATARVVGAFSRALTRPNIGFLIGVFIGVIRPVHNLFYSENAPLAFITDVLELLGDPVVPIANLILGIKMAHFWEARKAGTERQVREVPRAMYVMVVVVKLIILPTVIVAGLVAATSAGILADEPLIPIVLVVQAATPMPVNTIILGELYGHSSGIISSLQLISYAVSFFTVIIFTAVALALFV
mmetsp:Transcript_7626/g.24417  ORF Transcript_7626/g.24417 Transcript_7626/m.24417 type:complete len:525 (-) Transcript_7626:1230-2804(-)